MAPQVISAPPLAAATSCDASPLSRWGDCAWGRAGPAEWASRRRAPRGLGYARRTQTSTAQTSNFRVVTESAEARPHRSGTDGSDLGYRRRCKSDTEQYGILCGRSIHHKHSLVGFKGNRSCFKLSLMLQLCEQSLIMDDAWLVHMLTT